MAQPYLSFTRAKELLVEIVESSPRGERNPQETYDDDPSGVCTYDDGNGNHCIVGEILHRMGIPLPDDNGGIQGYAGTYLVERGYTSKDVRFWLAALQDVFDSPKTWKSTGSYPQTWRQALKECRKKGLL